MRRVCNLMSRELGRNDPCWCGSGKKYKKCHLNRDNQEPLSIDEINRIERRAFGAEYCMHPLASRQTCKGGIVRAHTIQRNGGLSRIAEEGHVYSCLARLKYKNGDPHFYSPSKVGARQASTFTGFCSYHDTSTFEPLDNKDFTCSLAQIFLLQYRALCKELFLKRADAELTTLRRNLDKGRDIAHQRFVQEFANLYTAGVHASLSRLEKLKEAHDTIFLESDYSDLKHYTIGLDVQPQIQSSAVHQPDFGFAGEHFQDIADLRQQLDWLHFSLIPADHGGFAVFSWLGEAEACEGFIGSLHRLENAQIPHALVRFVFEYFENTFFAPKWWEELPATTQKSFIDRQFAGLEFTKPHRSDCLLDDGIRAVDWCVVSRQWHGISVGG